ncbi:WxL domain-containing protein [Schleiferilactobacillus harbinensis]|nr:WxL domain-containing protein [Schleiferilactobacillus harbinensis]
MQLAQASTYTTQADVLQWGANDIQLSIPQQNVTPDVYQTTLTWTIKDGL